MSYTPLYRRSFYLGYYFTTAYELCHLQTSQSHKCKWQALHKSVRCNRLLRQRCFFSNKCDVVIVFITLTRRTNQANKKKHNSEAIIWADVRMLRIRPSPKRDTHTIKSLLPVPSTRHIFVHVSQTNEKSGKQVSSTPGKWPGCCSFQSEIKLPVLHQICAVYSCMPIIRSFVWGLNTFTTLVWTVHYPGRLVLLTPAPVCSGHPRPSARQRTLMQRA